MIVQQYVIPASFHQFWQYNGDVLVEILVLHLQGILHDGLDNKSKGRLQQHQFGNGKVRVLSWVLYQSGPVSAQALGVFAAFHMENLNLR